MTAKPLEIISGLLFPLLLLISLFSIFGYSQLAGSLIELNIMLVGLYLVINMNQQLKLISPNLFFLVLILILVIDLTNLNYQPFLFLNIGIFALCLLMKYFTNQVYDSKVLICIFSVPLVLTLINMLAIKQIVFDAFTVGLWDAAFITIGIWLIAKHHLDWLSRHAFKWILAAMLVFCILLIQLPIGELVILKPITFFNVNLDYGNLLSTPHLSIYSAIIMVVATYLLLNKSWQAKIICLIVITFTAQFIVKTSWRPMWLGLLIGGLFAFIFCYPKQRKLTIITLIILQVLMLFFNLGGYKDRMFGLWSEKKTEERNFIWQDAWQMQMASPANQWLIGHGIMSYQEDFKKYSRFYNNPNSIVKVKSPAKDRWQVNQAIRKNLSYLKYFHEIKPTKLNDDLNNLNHFSKPIPFASPHNIFLDLLYVTGIIGLIFVMLFYIFTIKCFVRFGQNDLSINSLSCTMICSTISLVVVIGLNFPFFKHFNLLPLAYILGVMAFMHERKNYFNLKKHTV